jgi:hypothetical protein
MRRRGPLAGRSVRCSASVTAIPRSSRGMAKTLHGMLAKLACRSATSTNVRRWSGDPTLQFLLHVGTSGFRMNKPIPSTPGPNATIRTCVRIASVRRPAYSTNTCSVHRPTPKCRGVWLGRCGWCARSCCSRTTVSATGRSQGSTPSGLESLSGTRMVKATIAMVRIHIGWLFRAGWVRGARGSLREQSRCAYVLSASELAPESRAALSRRSDLARRFRAGRGAHATPSTGWAWSWSDQQRHEPPFGAARVRK